MKYDEFYNSIIEKVMLKHNLGKIVNIEQSKSGMVNLCLFINDKYVLRINIRDQHINKFLREKTIFDFLNKNNFKVPKVILYDNEQDIIPYEYIILEKKKDIELKKILLNTNQIKKKELVIKAGKLLGELHKFKFNKFGDINLKFGNHNSWPEYILTRIKEDINTCNKLKIFKPNILKSIIELFENNINIFENIKESNLIHYDFNFSNLLTDGNNITYVVDFEWSRIGDKLMDFAVLEIEEFDDNPKIKKWFYKGYKLTNEISNDFENTLKFYKLIYLLEISIPIKLHRSKEALIWIKKEVIKLVNELKE